MNLSEKLKIESSFINSESVLKQGIIVPRKNFLRYPIDLDFLFQDQPQVFLTRQRVFGYFHEDNTLGVISSIVWGFPRGTLPGGRSILQIFENLKFFSGLVGVIKKSQLNETSFALLNSITGIKNGATTKMLYFSGSKIGEAKCLIFDSRVRDFLLDQRPVEFDNTLKHLSKNSLYPGWLGYSAFCQDVNNISKNINISEDYIEMYLFNNAPNRRKAQHMILNNK